MKAYQEWNGRRRGLSSAGIAGLLVGGVVLLGAGYLIGVTHGSRSDSVARPGAADAAVAPAPAPATGPDRTSDVRPPAVSSGPAFRFEPPELDFGQIAIGESVTGSFDIVNTGSEPLTIMAMRADCQCTTMNDLTGTVIEPGARTQVAARLDSKSYPSNSRSRIRFVFDGQDPVQYELRATVTHPVQAMPPFMQAQDVRAGELEVHSTDGREFTIFGAGGEAPVYTCGFDPRIDAPRARYRLAWDFSEIDVLTCKGPDGRVMPRWWVIETDHPGAPIVDVRVRHAPCTQLELPTAGRLWMLSEARHLIGRVEPGSSHEFTISLRWLQNRPPNDAIREIVGDGRIVDAELVDISRDGDEITCRVRVTVRPDHEGLIYTEIRFHAFNAAHSAGLTIIGRAERSAVTMGSAGTDREIDR